MTHDGGLKLLAAAVKSALECPAEKCFICQKRLTESLAAAKPDLVADLVEAARAYRDRIEYTVRGGAALAFPEEHAAFLAALASLEGMDKTP